MRTVCEQTMKFKIGQRVRILSSKKISGEYNCGVIIGVSKDSNAFFYKDEKQFYKLFTIPVYKVAYVDVATKSGCAKWFNEQEIEKK